MDLAERRIVQAEKLKREVDQLKRESRLARRKVSESTKECVLIIYFILSFTRSKEHWSRTDIADWLGDIDERLSIIGRPFHLCRRPIIIFDVPSDFSSVLSI